MKKSISILLLALLLYNTVGFYLYFEYRQTQARRQLREFLDKNDTRFSQQNLDRQVATGDWVVFQIPITLYHQTDRDLEAIEGELHYQGRIYEKAMRSIRNDTVYIYCANNQIQEQVHSQLSDYVKTHVVDFTGSSTDKHQKTLKAVFLQEYLPVEKHVFAFQRGTFQSPSASLPEFGTSSRPLEVASPPPRTA